MNRVVLVTDGLGSLRWVTKEESEKYPTPSIPFDKYMGKKMNSKFVASKSKSDKRGG